MFPPRTLEQPMIRTIAAAVAALALTSFAVRADDAKPATTPAATPTTPAATDTKPTKMEKKADKKAEKAAPDAKKDPGTPAPK
jgi:hypothetical protein